MTTLDFMNTVKFLYFFQESEKFFSQIHHGLNLDTHSMDKLARASYELKLEESLNNISRIHSI